MFTPSSLSIALLMMITSAVCWGSWANTYKGVKGYRFELFYWDYAVGIFLISLVLAFTMGSTGNDSSSFLNNVHAEGRASTSPSFSWWLRLTWPGSPARFPSRLESRWWSELY